MQKHVRVRHYDSLTDVPSSIKESAHELLRRTIHEGSVDLPLNAYDVADSWTLGLATDGKVVAFAAHKYFNTPVATFVQVMGTFLDQHVRGRAIVPVINSIAPRRAFLKAPRIPVYLCSRTRNPAAYAAARRFFDVYPKLDVGQNERYGVFADGVARMIYGGHVNFDGTTFLMENSYPTESKFLEPISASRKSEIGRFFADTVRYDANHAIFLMSRVKLRHQFGSYLQQLRANVA